MISAQYVDGLELRNKELLERIAHHERTNAEQAAMLNKVIAERDAIKAEWHKAYDIGVVAKQQLAAVTAERDDYRVALVEVKRDIEHMIKGRYLNLCDVERELRTVLAKYAPTEDPIEEARRKV